MPLSPPHGAHETWIRPPPFPYEPKKARTGFSASHGGKANFFEVRKSHISKSLSSFRDGKSANFFDVPVRKSQIPRQFLCLLCKSENFYKYCTTQFQNSPKSHNSKTIFWFCTNFKSSITVYPIFARRIVSANWQIFDLRNLFAAHLC
jgi:hypothetical protein